MSSHREDVLSSVKDEAQNRDKSYNTAEKTQKSFLKWEHKRRSWTTGITKRKHRFNYKFTNACDVMRILNSFIGDPPL